MSTKKITVGQLRKLIREAILDEGVLDQASPAAQTIARSLGEFMSGPAIRSQLKGVKVDDPGRVWEEVLNLTRVGVFRDPLMKLANDLAGRETVPEKQTGGPTGKPKPATGDAPDQRSTVIPPKM